MKTRTILWVTLMLGGAFPLWAEQHPVAETPPLVKAEAFFSITPEEDDSPFTYFSAHLVSQRFLPVYLFNGGRIILHESVDLEESSMREMNEGLVTLTAYKIQDSSSESPILASPASFWRISGWGRGGDLLFDEQVYRLEQAGCCDMSRREVYYDLYTGAELFATTTPGLAIFYDGGRTARYIGYDDGFGRDRPAAMEADRTISGLLTYAGSRVPPQYLAILADPEQDYRTQDFSLRLNGAPVPIRQQQASLWMLKPGGASFADELTLRVDIHCYCETDEFVEIPIVNDRLVVERAVTSPGIQVFALPDGPAPALINSGRTGFTDPFAYCDWVGAAIEPGALYGGDPKPEAIVDAIRSYAGVAAATPQAQSQ